MSPTSELRARVSELVRSAEKQLLSGRHEVALDHLRRAQELDPQNQYIQAIIQRAELAGQPPVKKEIPAPGHESARYLSVTVGDSRKGPSAEESLSPDETTRRIRELTETAQVLLNRGLRESAFDTLMRAYLLDPLHPDVLSCEQTVLPAWEDLRRVRAEASANTPAGRLRAMRREEAGKERRLWQALAGPPPDPESGGKRPEPRKR